MARVCSVCDKRPRVANLVSKANNKVKRWVYPNVHKMRYIVSASGNNNIKSGSVCAKCVKAGKVKKVV